MEHFLLLRLLFCAAMLVFLLLLVLVIMAVKVVSRWITTLKSKRAESRAERAGVIHGPAVDALDQLAA